MCKYNARATFGFPEVRPKNGLGKGTMARRRMAGTLVAERGRERHPAGSGNPTHPRARKRNEELCRELVAAYATGEGPSARAAAAQASAGGATDPFAVQRSRWRPGPPEPLAVLLAFGFLLAALVFAVTALFGVP